MADRNRADDDRADHHVAHIGIHVHDDECVPQQSDENDPEKKAQCIALASGYRHPTDDVQGNRPQEKHHVEHQPRDAGGRTAGGLVEHHVTSN